MTRYGVESEYTMDVVSLNSFDITTGGMVEGVAGNIDLVLQRKKFRPN